jgi:hypothetical protein
MKVRSDIISKIEFEDYGKDPTTILADFQQEDPTYTLKDVDDYLTLVYDGDQLEWADLEDGIICSLKIFKKGDEYWGTEWFDTAGMDEPDAYVDLEPLVVQTTTRYVKKSNTLPLTLEAFTAG